MNEPEARRVAVIQQLRTVHDPCSIAMAAPIDICDMGLVDAVEIDDAHVCVRLVLTDVGCVHYRGMRQHVMDAVRRLAWVDDVSVELDASVMWTPDRVRVRPSRSARPATAVRART